MKAKRLFIHLHQRLFRLFPASYRREYEAELAWVIGQAVEQAARTDRLAFIRLVWRELRDLPAALLREHIRSRREPDMTGVMPPHPVEEPIVGWKLLAVLLPFLILMGSIAGSLFFYGMLAGREWLGLIIAYGLLGLLLVMLILGVTKGLPRWSMPGFGLAMGVVNLLVLASLNDYLPALPWPDSILGRLISGFLGALLFYLPLFLFSVLLVSVSAYIPLLRPFYLLVRRDWSLLSFLLFGAALFTLMINDPYHGLAPYQLVSLAILGVSAWIYLRLSKPRLRLAALLVGLILAMGVMSLAIYQVYPLQSWSAYSSFPRWWEAAQPLLHGLALLVLLSLPALLSLFTPQPTPPALDPA